MILLVYYLPISFLDTEILTKFIFKMKTSPVGHLFWFLSDSWTLKLLLLFYFLRLLSTLFNSLEIKRKLSRHENKYIVCELEVLINVRNRVLVQKVFLLTFRGKELPFPLRSKDKKCSSCFVLVYDLENFLHLTDRETKPHFVEMWIGRNNPSSTLDIAI